MNETTPLGENRMKYTDSMSDDVTCGGDSTEYGEASDRVCCVPAFLDDRGAIPTPSFVLLTSVFSESVHVGG